MAVIEVQDLFKSYGSVDAVRGISFRVDQGEVFALLGPNGAGKSTTLEILEGHRRRSGGQVSVLGYDPQVGGRAMRERIGIVLQSAGIDAELTVAEVLSLYGASYPRELPTREVIALVGLEAKHRMRVKTLSGGQLRRLDLALALVGDPDLIFLDEPTVGFDPAARHGAWEIIERLRGLGRTIILTSHYMDEVQHLADRAAIIAAGRIVAQGPPSSLGGPGHAASRISFSLPGGLAIELLPPGLQETAEQEDGHITIRTADPTRAMLDLCGWAVASNVRLDDLQVTRPSLEDVYLRLTQESGDGTSP